MKQTLPACPVCDKGKLTETTYTGKFNPRPARKEIRVEGLKCCLCDSCGADPVLTYQIIYNQVKIADAKRTRIGLLTSAEIKKIRQKLNLTPW